MSAAICAHAGCTEPVAPYKGRGRRPAYCLTHSTWEAQRERNSQAQRDSRAAKKEAAAFGLCHPNGHSLTGKYKGKCERCGKDVAPERPRRLVGKRSKGLLRGEWSVERGGGRTEPHWLAPPGCKNGRGLTNVGGEEAWKAAPYKPSRIGIGLSRQRPGARYKHDDRVGAMGLPLTPKQGPLEPAVYGQDHAGNPAPNDHGAWGRYTPRPSVEVDHSPGPDPEDSDKFNVLPLSGERSADAGVSFGSKTFESPDWRFRDGPPWESHTARSPDVVSATREEKIAKLKTKVAEARAVVELEKAA